jgi:hypothetical protein
MKKATNICKFAMERHDFTVTAEVSRLISNAECEILNAELKYEPRHLVAYKRIFGGRTRGIGDRRFP